MTSWKTTLCRSPAFWISARASARGCPSHVRDVDELGPRRDRDLDGRAFVGLGARARALGGDQVLRGRVARRLRDRDFEACSLELVPRTRLGLAENVGNLHLPDPLRDPHFHLGAFVDPLPFLRVLIDDLSRRSLGEDFDPLCVETDLVQSIHRLVVREPHQPRDLDLPRPARHRDRHRAPLRDLCALPGALLDDDVLFDPRAGLPLDLGLEPRLLDHVDRPVHFDSLHERHADRGALLQLLLDLVVGPPAGQAGSCDQERDEKPRHPAPAPLRRLVVRARGRIVGRPPRRRGRGRGCRHHARRALREELRRLACRRPGEERGRHGRSRA